MLFRFKRSHSVLQPALREAVVRQRPADLQQLFAKHGEREFANALGDLSGRTISNALAMLTATARAAVMHHLSSVACERMHEAEGCRQPLAGHWMLAASL